MEKIDLFKQMSNALVEMEEDKVAELAQKSLELNMKL
jgi:methanogenic corrinoid protein MtbC1